jgi:hypothetical protein
VCWPECFAPGPDRVFRPAVLHISSAEASRSAGSVREPPSEQIEGLDRPAQGGLDEWAERVLRTRNYTLPIGSEEKNYNLTSMYLLWVGDNFTATVGNLTGCTSVVLAYDCGIYVASRTQSSPPLHRSHVYLVGLTTGCRH